MILAIANQKGGVGKTTAAISLAAVWASEGRPTLLIDMDPQGNAGAGLGIDEASLEWTVAEVLRGECEPKDAVMATGVEHLFLLPADIGLAALEAEEVAASALAPVVRKLHDDFERIVIDCPPSLGRLTLCALAAADRVLVPIRAGKLSMVGLRQLLTTIDNVRVRGINPSVRPLGIFINEAQPRTHLHQRTEEAVRSIYGELVMDTCIPANVALGEAVTLGRPITSYAPDAAGSRAFRALAEEVNTRWHRVVRIA